MMQILPLREQDAILTKDNLIKRKWQGDHLFFSCPVAKITWGIIALCFQQQDRPASYSQFWAWMKKSLPDGENMYMFGLAAVCWATWKTRNRICFDKIIIRNVSEILFYAIALMRYWTGLHPEETQRMIDVGVNQMMKTAMRLVRRTATPTSLRIRDVADDEGDEENNSDADA
jgi:hypothetical protein